MNARAASDPPAALKIAIVVGFVTLIAGLAGATYLRLLGVDTEGASLDVTIVRLTNVPPGVKLQVTATWSERGQTRTEDAQRGTEAGVWSFYLAPRGESLTLTVWRVEDGSRLALFQRAVALDRLEPVTVQLPKQ